MLLYIINIMGAATMWPTPLCPYGTPTMYYTVCPGPHPVHNTCIMGAATMWPTPLCPYDTPTIYNVLYSVPWSISCTE